MVDVAFRNGNTGVLTKGLTYLIYLHCLHDRLGRKTPDQEDNVSIFPTSHSSQRGGSELLPPPLAMRIGFVCSNREATVQEQDTELRERC